MTHYDITIIGAGPAGATLARTLQDNYKVLLVDKRPLDTVPSKRIKNCGGLIAPDAQKALAGLGLSIPQECAGLSAERSWREKRHLCHCIPSMSNHSNIILLKRCSNTLRCIISICEGDLPDRYWGNICHGK